MEKHSNRFWRKTTQGTYFDYRVVSEATVDGYDFALVERTNKEKRHSAFYMYVDLSKYRSCFEMMFCNSLACRKESYFRPILGFEAHLGDMSRNVYFWLRSCSPSLWDNGFGTAFYAEGKVYDRPDGSVDRIRDALRTGIDENHIGQYMESMGRDIVHAMEPVIRDFEECGAPVLKPDIDDF